MNLGVDAFGLQSEKRTKFRKRDVLIGEITKNRIGRENSIMDESL